MDYISIAKDVFDEEIKEFSSLRDNIDENFSKVVYSLLTLKGKLIIIGVGKSGFIGAKASSTFSSIGVSSFFLHPSDALHGSLGSIDKNDIVLFLSKSGENHEILSLLPYLIDNIKISICANMQSSLVKNSDISINSCVSKEVCPLNLAPTTSSNAMLLLLDALAVAIMKTTNFTKDSFSLTHPYGELTKNIRK
jgi:arabinose-5-phosphate isomerase